MCSRIVGTSFVSFGGFRIDTVLPGRRKRPMSAGASVRHLACCAISRNRLRRDGTDAGDADMSTVKSAPSCGHWLGWS